MIPKVSIIVPIYNEEKQLRRCVDSILNQTIKDIEVILVDDGSPDNCGSICDEYEKIDKRIKVIHKINGGLSSARNAGAEIATGEYIGFIDSDDWIEKDMYEKLYSIASSQNSDIAKCGYNVVCEGTVIEKFIPEVPQGTYEKEEIMDNIFPSTIASKFLFSNKTKYSTLTAWSHIYKKEFYDKCDLTFVSEREILSEDFVFNFQAYLKANRITILDNKLYNYDVRIGSLSRGYRSELYKRKLSFYNCFYKGLEQNNLIVKYQDRLNNQYINNMFECIINESYQANKVKLFDRIKNMGNILEDQQLKQLLIHYPTKDMHLKGKITFFLMKNKLPLLFYIIYRMQRKFKKVNI